MRVLIKTKLDLYLMQGGPQNASLHMHVSLDETYSLAEMQSPTDSFLLASAD